MPNGPKFTVSREDKLLINEIANRALAMDIKYNGRDALGLIDWQMYFTACHANGNPLDLEKLLAADDFNFGHDAFGIARHLSQKTGKLQNHFSPRCSARQPQVA